MSEIAIHRYANRYKTNSDFFAEILDRESPADRDPENFWDLKADEFQAAKRTYGTQLTEKVLGALKTRNILDEESAVLDVGCAYGRYALPFAETARSVVASDVSSKMVEMCERNARGRNLDNLSCVKHDWLKDGLGDFEKAFDVVFASMCTAARTTAGLKKMTEASRKHCVAAQYTDIRDDLLEELAVKAEADLGRDPHKGGEVAWAIFNWLWLEGLEPEIFHLERSENALLPLDEAAARYRLNLGKAVRDKGLDLRSLLEPHAEDGRIRATGKTSLALICWKAPPARA